MGTKQTTLRAGSPYRKVCLEEGSVFGVCECMTMCGGGVDVTLWVQLTLKPQHSAVDSRLFFFFYFFCPVSVSEAAHVLYRVKVGQGKHLVSFSSTNFVQVIKITASHSVNKSLKL